MRRLFWLPILCALNACTGTRPKLGLIDGKLTPCDKSSHCVNSQSTEPDMKVDPIKFSDSVEQAKLRLHKIIEETARTTFIEEKPDYWRVEYKSFVWRFVDDVEFLFSSGQIDVRSGSRMGHLDFGMNRSRVESIRTRFDRAPASPY